MTVEIDQWAKRNIFAQEYFGASRTSKGCSYTWPAPQAKATGVSVENW